MPPKYELQPSGNKMNHNLDTLMMHMKIITFLFFPRYIVFFFVFKVHNIQCECSAKSQLADKLFMYKFLVCGSKSKIRIPKVFHPAFHNVLCFIIFVHFRIYYCISSVLPVSMLLFFFSIAFICTYYTYYKNPSRNKQQLHKL